MSSSGLIYVAIVGAWAAYLVPRCLRRSDDPTTRRLGDRASASSRVLDRRERRQRYRPDDAHYSLLRLRPAVRPTPVVKKHGPAAQRAYRPGSAPAYWRASAPAPQGPAHGPAYPAAYGPAYPAGYGPSYGATARRSPSTRAPARPPTSATIARRRRVLCMLSLASAVGAPAGLIGWVPVWAGGLPVLLLVTYVAELRAQLQRRRAVGLRQRRGRSVARVRRRRLDFAARLDAVRRALRPTAAPAVPPVPSDADPPVEVHDGWQPVAVPLPTYVTAPKAPIRVRTIDVSREGAWASAAEVASEDHCDDDTAEIPIVTVPAQAAPGSIEEPAEQRAVND